MRCMVIVKGNKESEAGVLPSPEILNAMGKFNEELVKAGILTPDEPVRFVHWLVRQAIYSLLAPAERLYREARPMRIYEGATEVILDSLARQLVKRHGAGQGSAE